MPPKPLSPADQSLIELASIDLTRLLKLREDVSLLSLGTPAWPCIGECLQFIDPADRIVNRLRVSNRLIAYLKPYWISECLHITNIERKTLISFPFRAQVTPAAALN